MLGHGAPVSSHVEMRGLVLKDRAGVVLFLHAIDVCVFVCVPHSDGEMARREGGGIGNIFMEGI